MRHADGSCRLAAVLVGARVDLHGGAGAGQHAEECRARGVQADASDLNGRSGQSRGGHGPEGRRRGVAGHAQSPRRERAPALHRHGQPLDARGRAERRQRPFRMIPRGGGLDHGGGAARVQASQQHGALHLGAGDLWTKVDPGERAAVDAQRRTAVVVLHARPHALQRHRAAPHRPAPERGVAGDLAPERVPGQHAGEHPHRGAGVVGFEDVGWREGPAKAAAFELHPWTVTADVDAEAREAGEGGRAVAAGRVIVEPGAPAGEGAEEGVAMRDRLVAGNHDAPAHPRRWPDAAGVRRC